MAESINWTLSPFEELRPSFRQALWHAATMSPRERLSAIHYGVSAGKNFGTALKLAGHEFPDPMAMHFLEVLATRKGFAESMERFSNRWLEQTLQRVEAIAKSLIGASSMTMGIMMILVVIGIFQLAGISLGSAITQ